MSVIAKVDIRAIKDFGSGHLVELGCVCANDLMAAYAESEEDKLFTKYSPWGEIKLHQRSGWMLGAAGDGFYVMIAPKDEAGDLTFPGAVGHGPARIVSITDFGDNQAKSVEISSAYKMDGNKGIDNFNWKMSVDNPPVIDQFRNCLGSENDWWIAFYPTANFDRDAAIAAFHRLAKEKSDA